VASGLARSRLVDDGKCPTDRWSEYQSIQTHNFSTLWCLLLYHFVNSNCLCVGMNYVCSILTDVWVCWWARTWLVHFGVDTDAENLTTKWRNSPLTSAQPITTRRLYLSLRNYRNHWTPALWGSWDPLNILNAHSWELGTMIQWSPVVDKIRCVHLENGHDLF
jgi:hypothetical protein